MIELDNLNALAMAFGLGLLVGLQRQRADKSLAGIRTFPLITVFGTLCALLAEQLGQWLVASGLIAVVILMAVENLRRTADPPNTSSITTEAALLVMFAVGAWLVVGERSLALAVTGTVLVLLYAKQPMHGFVQRLSDKDLSAIVQFVVISLIILPLLPNQAYGSYQVLNPFEIWLMVVLIVGLNLAGYVAYQSFSTRSGTLIAGLLGGLVSSTATTFSYSRQVRHGDLRPALAALIIITASSIMYGRILLEIAIVAPSRLATMAPPLVLMLLLSLIIVAVGLLRVNDESHSTTPLMHNPAELKPALWFGALYGVVLFTIAAVQELFGEQTLYLVALISGLTDVDAITLSTARLVNDDRLTAATGWRLILTATLANLSFKLTIVGLLGGSVLLRRTLLMAAFSYAGGLLLIGLWPDTMVAKIP